MQREGGGGGLDGLKVEGDVAEKEQIRLVKLYQEGFELLDCD